jgi:hypothetical protein
MNLSEPPYIILPYQEQPFKVLLAYVEYANTCANNADTLWNFEGWAKIQRQKRTEISKEILDKGNHKFPFKALRDLNRINEEILAKQPPATYEQMKAQAQRVNERSKAKSEDNK